MPILLIILLGYIVGRTGLFTKDFYKKLNKLCFRLFLPLQIFINVYDIDDLKKMNWRVMGLLIAGIFICLIIGIVSAKLFVPERSQRGVIVQASFRSNQAVLGLPLANSLGGDAVLAFTSLATSLCVPLFNLLAVLVLSYYAGDEAEKPTAGTLAKRVFTNPLIVAALSALALVLIRQVLPTSGGHPIFTIKYTLPSVYKTLVNLSKVAAPVMLFVLGALLDFRSFRSMLPQLSLGVLLRIVICPAIVIGAAVLLRAPLGITTAEMCTVISVAATPVALSSAVMVQEIGGDDQLAGQLVVMTSVLSMLTIFCFVYFLRYFAFL